MDVGPHTGTRIPDSGLYVRSMFLGSTRNVGSSLYAAIKDTSPSFEASPVPVPVGKQVKAKCGCRVL